LIRYQSSMSSLSNAHLILLFEIIDRLLGLEPVAWLERLWPFEEGARQHTWKMRKPSKAPPSVNPPTYPPEEFTGKYENPGYGVITITHEQGKLFLDFAEKSPLLHFNQNVFEGFQLYSYFKFRFDGDSNGKITSIAARLEPMVPDIVFGRIEQN